MKNGMHEIFTHSVKLIIVGAGFARPKVGQNKISRIWAD